jgi:hypothetical protein
MRQRVTTDAQDRHFLAMVRKGWSCRKIGLRHNVKTSTVYAAVSRARLAERPAGAPPRGPALEPLFPVDSFTPDSACPHHGPIKRGSIFVCMVCHQSGLDNHPALRRVAAHDPQPEPRVEPPPPRKKTRRERRGLLERIEPSAN